MTTSVWQNIRIKTKLSFPPIHQGHQVRYLVPRTTDCLSPLWSNTGHWPYAPGVCSGTGVSWRILHSWLIEYSLWDNSPDLHSGVPVRRGILLSDMSGQTFYTIDHLNHPIPPHPPPPPMHLDDAKKFILNEIICHSTTLFHSKCCKLKELSLQSVFRPLTRTIG